MPVRQEQEHPRHFGRFSFLIPDERVPASLTHLAYDSPCDTPQHRQHRAPEQKIVEMANLFMLSKEDDLTQGVIGQGLEDEICTTIHVGGNCLCPRAIALEQYFQAFARHTRPGGKTFDLAS